VLSTSSIHLIPNPSLHSRAVARHSCAGASSREICIVEQACKAHKFTREIGRIDDLVVGLDRVLFAVIQVDGIGSHYVAVLYDSGSKCGSD
jgi:hypothetical protein